MEKSPLRAEHARLKAEVDKLQEELDIIGKEISRLQAKLEKEQRTLQAVRNSLSFQLGSMMIQAVRQPGRNTILLPYRVFRLGIRTFRKKPSLSMPRAVGKKAYVLETVKDRINEIKQEMGSTSTCAVERNGIEYVASSGFQDNVSRDTIKWDKEWMRYFSIHKDYNFYFYDMDTDNYLLSYSPERIAKFGKKEMYFTKLYKNINSGIWVPGSEVVGKKVVEMGCGPGIFGRIAGRVCNKYFGIDISQFALYIARLTSPKNCQYVHLSNVSALREIAGTMDISVSRHFFIHHNYEDSLWILCFLKDLIKHGGIISADFYYNPKLIDGVRIRCATDPLNEDHPSSLFHFNYDDILRLAADSQLEPINIDLIPEIERQFTTFKVIDG